MKQNYKFLNMATIGGIESSHLLFLHLLQTILDQTIKTIPIAVPKWKELINVMWSELVSNNPCRPSSSNITPGTFNISGKLKLKEINLYCSSFEWSVHGAMFGVNPKHLQILTRVVQWIGKSFSDTVDDELMKFLRQECVEIIQQIESMDDLKCLFAEKQTLQTFIQLVYNCYKWHDIPTHFFGMKFETSHLKNLMRINQNQNYKKQNMLLNISKKSRISKNASFMRCDMQNNFTFKYGQDIQENLNLCSPLEQKGL